MAFAHYDLHLTANRGRAALCASSLALTLLLPLLLAALREHEPQAAAAVIAEYAAEIAAGKKKHKKSKHKKDKKDKKDKKGRKEKVSAGVKWNAVCASDRHSMHPMLQCGALGSLEF